MTPLELTTRLVALFPDFAVAWQSAENVFRESVMAVRPYVASLRASAIMCETILPLWIRLRWTSSDGSAVAQLVALGLCVRDDENVDRCIACARGPGWRDVIVRFHASPSLSSVLPPGRPSSGCSETRGRAGRHLGRYRFDRPLWARHILRASVATRRQGTAKAS